MAQFSYQITHTPKQPTYKLKEENIT